MARNQKSAAEKKYSTEVSKAAVAGILTGACAYEFYKHVSNARSAYQEVKVEREVDRLEGR